MQKIAGWMDDVARHIDDDKRLEAIGEDVKALCRTFPAPGIAV
jgi:glycine/serine hydroxymethyltransferase